MVRRGGVLDEGPSNKLVRCDKKFRLNYFKLTRSYKKNMSQPTDFLIYKLRSYKIICFNHSNRFPNLSQTTPSDFLICKIH